MQISRSKAGSLHRTPAGFTVLVLDGYGLRDWLPACPTSAASYPVSIRRVATLLHASFRRSLAVPPLRFASASPPSGCTGDLHPQAVGHVRHTVPRPWRAAVRLRDIDRAARPSKSGNHAANEFLRCLPASKVPPSLIEKWSPRRGRPDHTLAFVMSAINRAFARSMVLHCPHLREL